MNQSHLQQAVWMTGKSSFLVWPLTCTSAAAACGANPPTPEQRQSTTSTDKGQQHNRTVDEPRGPVGTCPAACALSAPALADPNPTLPPFPLGTLFIAQRYTRAATATAGQVRREITQVHMESFSPRVTNKTTLKAHFDSTRDGEGEGQRERDQHFPFRFEFCCPLGEISCRDKRPAGRTCWELIRQWQAALKLLLPRAAWA